MLGEPVYSLTTLFEQLGLPSEPDEINQFIKDNQLASDVHLHEASFWTPQQASFLKQGISRDASWTDVIDELNVRLHPKPAV